MKILPISILFVTLAVQCLGEEPQTVSKEWMALSVSAQNVANQLQMITPGTVPDPATFEDDLKAINSALNKLVESGEIQEKKIKLLPLNKLEDGGVEFLFDYARYLSEKYGYYTALEMIDMGLEKRLSIFQPDEPFPLHLRMPREQLEDFLAKAAKKGFIHKP